MQIHNKGTSGESVTLKCDDCGFAPNPRAIEDYEAFVGTTAFWDDERLRHGFGTFIDLGKKMDCCPDCMEAHSAEELRDQKSSWDTEC